MAKSSSDLSRNLERLTFAAMLKSTCSPGLEGSRLGSSGRAYRTISAFLQVASLVRTCLLLARGRVWEAPGPVFGGKCCGAFAWLDRDGLSWRTWQHSLDGGWEPWLDPWPRAGIAWNGIAYRQVPSAPLTRGTGCGSWATSRASDADRGGRGELLHQVKGGSPRGMLPTPSANDARGGGRRSPGQQNLHHVLKNQTGGQLNPTWVEWLMGYPSGWTDCEASATPSSPKSPS